MFTFKRTLSLLSLIALFLVACSPEDGATGPAGPIGPEGKIGPKGDDGEDGVDGAVNATSTYFVVDSVEWVQILDTTRGGRAYIIATLSVPELTQEVFDNGIVQIFSSRDNKNSWTAMPFSDANFNYSFSFVVETIRLRADVDDQGLVPFGFDSEYRVIIIPPSEKIEELDVTDFEAVQMVYGLNE